MTITLDAMQLSFALGCLTGVAGMVAFVFFYAWLIARRKGGAK